MVIMFTPSRESDHIACSSASEQVRSRARASRTKPSNVVSTSATVALACDRGPATLQAVQYYFKMPSDMHERDVIVLDPMLATGNSAVAALDRIKALKPRSVKFVCLLTCPEGIAKVHKAHPDVPIYTAAIDRELNDHGYILPGLGDAGDRIFGTT